MSLYSYRFPSVVKGCCRLFTNFLSILMNFQRCSIDSIWFVLIFNGFCWISMASHLILIDCCGCSMGSPGFHYLSIDCHEFAWFFKKFICFHNFSIDIYWFSQMFSCLYWISISFQQVIILFNRTISVGFPFIFNLFSLIFIGFECLLFDFH